MAYSLSRRDPTGLFFKGYLKSNRPTNINDLKTKICHEMKQITPEMLHNVLQKCQQRLFYCKEMNGAQFELMI